MQTADYLADFNYEGFGEFIHASLVPSPLGFC
jgi:hypothetical protein